MGVPGVSFWQGLLHTRHNKTRLMLCSDELTAAMLTAIILFLLLVVLLPHAPWQCTPVCNWCRCKGYIVPFFVFVLKGCNNLQTQ